MEVISVNLKQQIEELVNLKTQLIDKIKSIIRSIPQNERINIISDKPRTFTINISEVIGRPLIPSYYDFDKQGILIIENIIRSEDPYKAISEIIKTNKIVETFNFTYGPLKTPHSLHPTVKKYLIKSFEIEK